MPRSWPATRRSSASQRLTEFWETICRSALLPGSRRSRSRSRPWPATDRRARRSARLPPGAPCSAGRTDSSRRACRRRSCGRSAGSRRPASTTPRPLKETLERLVDFDRINARETRLSVGAVDIETGNFAYFDNASIKIVPEHIMASGALPPGFPAVEIEGRALLGRRPRLQHAADRSAGPHAAPRHHRLPGRPVELRRAAAQQHPRRRGAREGHPLFQPHPHGDRRRDRAAAPAPRPQARARLPAAGGRRRSGDRERCATSPAPRSTTSSTSSIATSSTRRSTRTTSSACPPCASIGRPGSRTSAAR